MSFHIKETEKNRVNDQTCSGPHGDADLGLLEGGSVVDTVTGHGRHLFHRLQVLNDLGLVEGLHAGKHAGVSHSLFLGSGQGN